MIYKVYSDSSLLYHSNLENLKIFKATAEMELGKSGSFKFTMYPDHPYYSQIKRLKGIITLYQDDYMLFRGRVLDEEVQFHNERAVSCEGDMAFFLDSVLRPFTISGTPAEILAYLLQLHNAQVDENKRFQPGIVTVEGFTTYEATEYLTTQETLEKALSGPFGGYLVTRYQDGVAYLDFLKEITMLSPQKIEFGKNLLDLKRIRKGDEIATVLIPLGAKIQDEEGKETNARLTIAAVNGGADFVQDDEAVSQYGVIVKSVIFDDITDAEALKIAGQAHLAQLVNPWETIEITAADLAGLGLDISAFHLGTMVRVISKPHGLDQLFTVVKLSVNLFNPADSKLVLGKSVQGFSEAVNGLSNAQGQIVQAIQETAQKASEAVYNVEQNLMASMQVTADNIQTTVAENYYLKDQTDALVSSVSTTIEQTQKAVEIQFTQFSQDIQAVAAGADAEFEEIKKYIRFTDGKILLGEVGNELELQIANDRISFLQDGAEVAYFSNRKLYVTDAQILYSLQLGKFAWMPRANGNLSFKKIS